MAESRAAGVMAGGRREGVEVRSVVVRERRLGQERLATREA